jgi:hypothetical protein
MLNNKKQGFWEMSTNQKFAAGFIGLIALVVIISSVSSPNSPANQNSQSQAQAEPSTPKKVRSAGDEGIIYVDGLQSITVAVDEDAYTELDKVFQAKDQYGYNQLQAQGKIFKVPNRTRVLLLENGFLRLKVRILEGLKKGYAGIIPREWFQ